jgi:hypothetical protein
MTKQGQPENDDNSATTRRISSETLALFIVDALIDADLVSKDNLQKALKITIEEIDVRKACGDY